MQKVLALEVFTFVFSKLTKKQNQHRRCFLFVTYNVCLTPPLLPHGPPAFSLFRFVFDLCKPEKNHAGTFQDVEATSSVAQLANVHSFMAAAREIGVRVTIHPPSPALLKMPPSAYVCPFIKQLLGMRGASIHNFFYRLIFCPYARRRSRC